MLIRSWYTVYIRTWPSNTNRFTRPVSFLRRAEVDFLNNFYYLWYFHWKYKPGLNCLSVVDVDSITISVLKLPHFFVFSTPKYSCQWKLSSCKKTTLQINKFTSPTVHDWCVLSCHTYRPNACMSGCGWPSLPKCCDEVVMLHSAWRTVPVVTLTFVLHLCQWVGVEGAVEESVYSSYTLSAPGWDSCVRIMIWSMSSR